MDATTCLTHFLERAVVAERRDRLAGFAGTAPTRLKFLASLDHELTRAIDASLLVASLPSRDWEDGGFPFSSDGVFGEPVETLRDGCARASSFGGWLLLSHPGRAAILRPEGRIDDERLFRL